MVAVVVGAGVAVAGGGAGRSGGTAGAADGGVMTTVLTFFTSLPAATGDCVGAGRGGSTEPGVPPEAAAPDGAAVVEARLRDTVRGSIGCSSRDCMRSPPRSPPLVPTRSYCCLTAPSLLGAAGVLIGEASALITGGSPPVLVWPLKAR